MRRILAAILSLSTACATGPHVYADDGPPAGVPKSARAHCRTWAAELAREAGADGAQDAIRTCLDGLLRADCAEELARDAEQLERRGNVQAAFWFRFPGAWEPDEVPEQADELKQVACTNAKTMAAALALFHGIRHGRGGRIPWSSFGAPGPGAGMCREGCPAK